MNRNIVNLSRAGVVLVRRGLGFMNGAYLDLEPALFHFSNYILTTDTLGWSRNNKIHIQI